MAQIEPLPVHIPLSTEAPAHVVERITNDGTMMVRDQTSGDLRNMRLGVAEVSGELTLVAISDP